MLKKHLVYLCKSIFVKIISFQKTLNELTENGIEDFEHSHLCSKYSKGNVVKTKLTTLKRFFKYLHLVPLDCLVFFKKTLFPRAGNGRWH